LSRPKSGDFPQSAFRVSDSSTVANSEEVGYFPAMQLTLEGPDAIQQALRVPEPERQSRLLLELACALYQREILSFGKAAELSQIGQFRFGHALTERGIARLYTDRDLAEDLAYASGQ
jgi:predicted HTH domain antitoxin